MATDTVRPTGTSPDSDPTRSKWQGFQALPKALRVTTYLIVLVVLLLIVSTIISVVVVRRSFPQTSGTIEIDGLSAPVDVLRDEQGIPQLYADTTSDLMMAQGYVQAQERFYEMDVRRHITAGRLAELFGEDAVETDAYVRTMDWRGVAERELALVAPETRAALESYADGVNAYLEDKSPGEISLEYSVLNLGGLDYRPEQWTPVDSLAWLKAMAWDLRGNMDDEIQRVLTAGSIGESRMRQLWPDYPYDQHAPIVNQGAVVDDVFEQDATEGGSRNPLRPPFAGDVLNKFASLKSGLDRMPELLGRGDGIGSNSWVVSGDKSSTGAPLLANDPHLGVSLPGVWMQMGLHCRSIGPTCPYDVAGFTFAGVPGVVIGHNADIAWGFTNLSPDVADLYVEKIRKFNGQDRALIGKVWQEVYSRGETIKVAGGDDVAITVRRTRHGPLLSDVDDTIEDVADQAEVPRVDDAGDEYAIALSWTALEAHNTADSILELNQAKDWPTFRAALADFAAPAQNVVYADREGHIGYQAPGRIPIRKSGNDGYLPSAGWLTENDWTSEYVPYNALPNVLDPDEGFIATANQAVIGPDYPYALTTDWDRGYRSQRIRDLLTEEGELSINNMAKLQLDNRNPMAPVLTPYLVEIQIHSGAYYKAGQRLLRTWDFTQPADSAAAAYYNVVWRNLLELTFHDELPDEAWPDGGQRWMGAVTDLLRTPNDPFWDDVDTEEVEQRDDILKIAMRDAVDDLTALESPNSKNWTWGGIHQLDLHSSTLGESGIGVIEALFNRGGWEVGGGGAIIDASSWDAGEGFKVTAAASMRMVVSLDNFDDSRWINMTGVSGHAFHPHYVDQTDLWARGETLGWAFSAEAVDAGAEDRLTLEPAS